MDAACQLAAYLPRMAPLLFRLLARVVLTSFGVITLVFLFLHLVPGDPVDAMLGESASPVDRQQLRQQLGLDEPLAAQYLHYMTRLVRGDLGVSLLREQTVSTAIAERYPATLLLTAAALLVALAIALPLGVCGAARPGGGVDRLAQVFAVLVVSLPSLCLGPLLLLVFAIWLEWLPVSGFGGPQHVVLPALTLGLGMSALLSRMLRASLLECLQEDYIRSARAKGISEAGIFLKHALRNAAMPLLSVLSLQTGALLGGAILTETIFAWPGLGRLLLQAIQSRDYPMVQGCILVIALTYVAVSLVTDMLYAVLDPRLRPGSVANP